MKMIKLPKRYNYAEAYLTLRCNLECSYCINNESGKVLRKRRELSAREWAEGLNRIDFNDIPLTIGGGEPTMHKQFHKLLNELNPNIRVDLLTNLKFDIEEFIKKIPPERFNKFKNPAYKSIRVSYHAEKMEPEDLIEKLKNLQNSGYNIGLFGLNHPLFIEKNMYMTELARINQIFFFVKDFLGEFDGKFFGNYHYLDAISSTYKKVKCRTRELLIGPEGDIYRCHRDLYLSENPVGNILDSNLVIKDIFRTCNYYGNCNPCDLKLKTNRFLQMGNCSIEIMKPDDE